MKAYYGDTKKYIGAMFERASLLVLNNYPIKAIQELLGRSNAVKSVAKSKELNKAIVSFEKKEVSPEVSKAVSEIEAPKDVGVSAEVYTVNSVVANQKVHPLSPDQLVKSQIQSEKNQTEEAYNVFNAEKAYIPLTEKKKLGGSSYPIKVQPMIASGDPQYSIQDNVIFGVDDAVMPVISEEKDISTVSKAPRNSFKYAPLDASENRSAVAENESLVPDLSSHQVSPSVRGAGLNLGISGEAERLSFAEDNDNGQRQPRRRREKAPHTRNQRRKKKESKTSMNSIPQETAPLLTT